MLTTADNSIIIVTGASRMYNNIIVKSQRRIDIIILFINYGLCDDKDYYFYPLIY